MCVCLCVRVPFKDVLFLRIYLPLKLLLLSFLQLMYYLKNVNVTIPHTGETIVFNNGDVDGYYDILNWQIDGDGEISYVSIGQYNGTAPPEARMTINNDSIVWSNERLEVRCEMIKGIQQQLCVCVSGEPVMKNS